MNKSKKKTALVLCITALIFTAMAVFAAEPGSDGDPLVTKSYIDGVIQELKSYVETKINSTQTAGGAIEADSKNVTESFEVVRLAQGQRITFSDSSELIVRMGTGKIIASEKGGIADVTAGKDLSDGEKTTANHHLIVPLDDGRGFEALDDVLVMVKGGYKIN